MPRRIPKWTENNEYSRKSIKASKKYKAIVIGVSSGGMEAMKIIFSTLPADFETPIVIVQHISPRSDSQWISILDKSCKLQLKEADEKEKIQKGYIYIAPPNYHLLIEKDQTFSLTIGERVNYARPAIDVLFETAAAAFRGSLIGIVLTGANHDGAAGLKAIKECGGLCMVQDPKTAVSAYMPETAIATVKPDYILPISGILELLISLDKKG